MITSGFRSRAKPWIAHLWDFIFLEFLCFETQNDLDRRYSGGIAALKRMKQVWTRRNAKLGGTSEDMSDRFRPVHIPLHCLFLIDANRAQNVQNILITGLDAIKYQADDNQVGPSLFQPLDRWRLTTPRKFHNMPCKIRQKKALSSL